MDALDPRLKHMNPRAHPCVRWCIGEVALSEVFDSGAVSPGTRSRTRPRTSGRWTTTTTTTVTTTTTTTTMSTTITRLGEALQPPSHQHGHGHGHHHHHDDDVKSFVYRSDRPFDPAKLEDFLGAIVNIYGPRMLRCKGVLNMKGTDRKVIFQGVHQLMGSDLGPQWPEGEERVSKMVFIGIDLPRDIFRQGWRPKPGPRRFPLGESPGACVSATFSLGGAVDTNAP